RSGAIAAILYAVCYTAGDYFHTSQRDGFIVPFMLLGILGLQNYVGRWSIGWLVTAGLGFGMVCLTRPTYTILVGLAAGYCCLISRNRGRRPLFLVRDIGLSLGLAVLPLIGFFAIYASRGAQSELYDLAPYLSRLRYFEPYTKLSILETVIGYP